jgi:hypothetical protein
MNDQLRKMAEQAGLCFVSDDPREFSECSAASVEAFARLVAEDCAGACDDVASKLSLPAAHGAQLSAEAIMARYS